MGAKVDLIC